MKHLVRKQDDDYHAYDVGRIVAIMARAGYHISRADARWAWEDFSNTMAAGWMSMEYESDLSILHTVLYRFTEEER